MTPSPDSTSTAAAFLAGVVRAGALSAVISPGSRSSPITVAAHRLTELTTHIHLDERSAAFAALGEAKVTGAPVLIICSSGTAGANYLPAVAEARQSDVPLVVVTADRPPEHHGWGVGQTFPQRGLFGVHVVEAIEMPVGESGGIDHAIRAGWRAAATATERRGPVHVNWPFRLPLEPTGSTGAPPVPAQFRAAAVPAITPREIDIAALEAATAHPEGVIIAGPYTVPPGARAEATQQAIWEFASRTGWPIMADVLSGLRGAPDNVPVVDMADLLARTTALPQPSVVMRLGDTPTAKSIRLWWESLSDAAHVLCDPSSRWQDPSHMATDRLHCDVAELLTSVAPTAHDGSWAQRWSALGATTRSVVDQNLEASEWTEAQIAHAVSSHPAVTAVVASSSMPVRDLDTMSSARWTATVHSNRGINGIDGVVSTAIGVSRGTGLRQTVLIGDVAILHDIGGVLDAVRQKVDLTIVIPNNNGGGIFSHLPIKEALDDTEYDRLFHTPHNTDFAFLGGVDGLHFARAERDTLKNLIEDANSRPGVSVIECPVETSDSVAHLHHLTQAVRAALS